ncbi:Scytalone dehydratase [Trichoderma chlorosporum]
MNTDIPLSDYLSIRNIAFEWAESYDTKDWGRLKECLAPAVRLDFRSLRGELHENLTPEAYSTILIGMIGDKRLRTQHFLGAAQWEVLSDGRVRVAHQIRAVHQRYTDETLTELVNKGHGLGVTVHWYEKVNGVWKLEGVQPRLDISEFDIYGTLAPPKEN